MCNFSGLFACYTLLAYTLTDALVPKRILRRKITTMKDSAVLLEARK